MIKNCWFYQRILNHGLFFPFVSYAIICFSLPIEIWFIKYCRHWIKFGRKIVLLLASYKQFVKWFFQYSIDHFGLGTILRVKCVFVFWKIRGKNGNLYSSLNSEKSETNSEEEEKQGYWVVNDVLSCLFFVFLL